MLLIASQTSTTAAARVTEVSGAGLVGAVNGVNTVFDTTMDFTAGDEAVYFNGVKQVEGASSDYLRSESGGLGSGYDRITLVVAPRARPGAKPDDSVQIDYRPA